jgi:flagellar biosynthesis protein FlhF
MPLEILTGPEVPALLTRAQKTIGEDAVVLSVRRVKENGRTVFEMIAADPVTAERQSRQQRQSHDGAEVVLAAERDRVAPSAPSAAPARTATAPGDDAVFWNLQHAPDVPVFGQAPAPAAPAATRRFGWPFVPSAATGRGARRPHVVALVGPTGAGKTTTIAKLANHPQAFGGKRVGMLCLDTYRIGGVEQSRQYAELARLPFEVVWEPRDIARAMRRLRDCAVVLVDTPGRGPRAANDLRETQERLLEIAPDETHLVLPAGLQRSLARRVVSAHLPLGVTHLLPTKIDEYPDERGLFELARQFALPMRWLADGQEVPRDLQVAPATPGVAAPLALTAEAV